MSLFVANGVVSCSPTQTTSCCAFRRQRRQRAQPRVAAYPRRTLGMRSIDVPIPNGDQEIGRRTRSRHPSATIPRSFAIANPNCDLTVNGRSAGPGRESHAVILNTYGVRIAAASQPRVRREYATTLGLVLKRRWREMRNAGALFRIRLCVPRLRREMLVGRCWKRFRKR